MTRIAWICLQLMSLSIERAHCYSLKGYGNNNQTIPSTKFTRGRGSTDQEIVKKMDMPETQSAEGVKYIEGESRHLESLFYTFQPQTCNLALDDAPCNTTLSSLFDASAGTEIIVECGTCVLVDYTLGEFVTLPLGLNVIGKLYFPSTANLVLRTQHIFVQGELVIDPPQNGNEVKLSLYGTTNQSLIPYGDNADLCGVIGCDMGKKPIVIAGGEVNIRGLEDPSCPSWVKLMNVSKQNHHVNDFCYNLVKENGDAEIGSVQPFYSLATSFQVLTELDGNNYFGIRNRNQWYNGISGNLPLECLNVSTFLEISFRYRLNATVPDKAIFRFAYTNVTSGQAVKTSYFECPHAADVTSGWVVCNFGIQPEVDIIDVSVLTFDLWMTSDSTSDLDFDDLSIKPSGSDVLHVDEKATSCWKPGDEVLLTSWLKDADRRVTATINSTDTGTLTLGETLPITTLATHAADPNFAIEVARLTRQVIFEAELDDSTREFMIGGHFMVYYTPGQIQVLQGVKIVNFGQQGEKGRYPIHFHLSGSVAGSTVSNNVIYKSNQRCIVVHGSNDLDITDNVAFETHGHCFITEDGIETGNNFTGNLGASIRRPTYVVEGENDDSPSIFWITNPQNTFVNNVAAGSEFSGFWFDTRTSVRGPSQAGNEGVNPQQLSLGTFDNNTAHSCAIFGIQYYSPGYRPLVEARMEGNNVYRNGQAGHFVHTNMNMRFVGGIAAYNGINVQTFRNSDIMLEGMKIIGYPDVDLAIEDYYSVTKCQGNRVGVSLHSWRLELDASSVLGFAAKDLDFSGMGSELGCSELRAFWVDPVQTQNAVSDTVNRVSGLTFHDDVNRIDFCDVLDAGVTNVVMQDEDGSFGSSTVPGFFVSDESATIFAGGNGCIHLNSSCVYWCESACLRQITFATSDAFATGNIEMVVSKDGITTFASWDHFSYLDTPTHNYLLGYDGHYGISLPDGTFDVSFVDITTRALTWPSYVKVIFEDAPECSSSNDGTIVNLIRPEATQERCGNVIKGGTFEDNSYTHWQNSYDVTMSIISTGSEGSAYALHIQNEGLDYVQYGQWVIVPPSAYRAEYAFRIQNGASDGMQVGQWIDLSCLIPDVEYKMQADVRLVDDSGVVASCDPSVPNNCPVANFHLYDYDIDRRVSKLFFVGLIGNVTSVSDDSGWYKLGGSIILSSEMLANATSALVSVQLLRDVNFQIDNVILITPNESFPTGVPSGIFTIGVSTTAPVTAVSMVALPSILPIIQSGMPTSLDVRQAPLVTPTTSPSIRAPASNEIPTSPGQVINPTGAPSRGSLVPSGMPSSSSPVSVPSRAPLLKVYLTDSSAPTLAPSVHFRNSSSTHPPPTHSLSIDQSRMPTNLLTSPVASAIPNSTPLTLEPYSKEMPIYRPTSSESVLVSASAPSLHAFIPPKEPKISSLVSASSLTPSLFSTSISPDSPIPTFVPSARPKSISFTLSSSPSAAGPSAGLWAGLLSAYVVGVVFMLC